MSLRASVQSGRSPLSSTAIRFWSTIRPSMRLVTLLPIDQPSWGVWASNPSAYRSPMSWPSRSTTMPRVPRAAAPDTESSSPKARPMAASTAASGSGAGASDSGLVSATTLVASPRLGTGPHSDAVPRADRSGGGDGGLRDVVTGQVGAQPAEDAAQDPRHLHLAHADPLADLVLGEVVHEPQVQHEALPLVEAAHRAAQRVADLVGAGVPGHHEQVVGQAGARRGQRVERGGVVAGRARPCLRDVGGRHGEHPGQLLVERVAEQDVAQPLLLDDETGAQLLDASRWAHRPALVAEPPLDLAGDGRCGVGGEAGSRAGSVAAHGLD